MEAPPELLMTLLPYQKEYLAWAVKQERGDIKGGILADEMGMGKTIQAYPTHHQTHLSSRVLQSDLSSDAILPLDSLQIFLYQ